MKEDISIIDFDSFDNHLFHFNKNSHKSAIFSIPEVEDEKQTKETYQQLSESEREIMERKRRYLPSDPLMRAIVRSLEYIKSEDEKNSLSANVICGFLKTENLKFPQFQEKYGKNKNLVNFFIFSVTTYKEKIKNDANFSAVLEDLLDFLRVSEENETPLTGGLLELKCFVSKVLESLESIKESIIAKIDNGKENSYVSEKLKKYVKSFISNLSSFAESTKMTPLESKSQIINHLSSSLEDILELIHGKKGLKVFLGVIDALTLVFQEIVDDLKDLDGKVLPASLHLIDLQKPPEDV